MAEQKKYRRLDEVYLKETFAKPVPPLPRQTIITEQPGMAEILIQKDQEDVIPFTIPNTLADKVLHIIRSQTKTKDKSGKEFSPDEIILKCLQIDKWVANEKDPLFDTISNIFAKVRLNYDNFGNLEDIQTDKNNPLRTSLLNVPQSVKSLTNLIPDSFRELFANSTDAEKVLTAIWKIIPQGHGGNVGPGEVALSLISDAVKGDVGDLEMAGIGKVEVKGAGARMGGDGFALTGTLDGLNAILTARKEGITSVSTQTLNILKQQLTNLIESKISSIEGQITRRLDTRRLQLLNSQLTLLKNIENLIKSADSLEEIVKDIDSAEDLDNNFKDGFIVKGKGDLRLKMKNIIGKYTAVKRGEKHGSRKGSKASFGPSITDFYSISDLTPEEKLAGVIAARSYTNTPDKLIRNAVFSLQQKYGDKIFTTGATSDEGDGGSPLNWLIAALHMAEYQQNQGFAYLIVFNTIGEKEDSAPDKVVSYRFDTSDLSVNIVNLFNFLMTFKAKITMSVDSTRKSVGVRIT